MMARRVFTTAPPSGDYILTPTGFTWHVRRTNGSGSLLMSAGERDKKAALATLHALAARDQADAWQTAGPGSFQLVRRYRPAR